MTFNSWGYVLALLLAVPAHWLLPHRFRLPFLAALNLAMYSMWRWEFSFLLIFSSGVDFISARMIHRETRPAVRRLWLVSALTINLGLLAYFKYTYFFVDNLGMLAGMLGFGKFSGSSIGLSIILPLGISFYTFHSISYTVDVYRRQIEPTNSYLKFITFVTFWPQLVAGPILRAAEVIPQLEARRVLDWTMVSRGMILIVFGLFKKAVIADNVAPFVDFWFGLDPGLLTAFDVWTSTFLFGFQIYFDFSGYSDIALGSALLLGVVFPENFNWPYMATSPKDFWQRWHISLSSWIRDYLYLPLTGQHFRGRSTGGIGVAAQEGGPARTGRALFLTWAIMGLWHGAAWTFVLWGLYHSSVIMLYRVATPLARLADRVPVMGWLINLPLAMAGWIFFRATSVEQSLTMMGKILNPLEYKLSPMIVGLSNPTAGWSYLWAAIITVGMAALYGVQYGLPQLRIPPWLQDPVRAVSLAAMTFFIVLFMQQTTQFIYFQF